MSTFAGKDLQFVESASSFLWIWGRDTLPAAPITDIFPVIEKLCRICPRETRHFRRISEKMSDLRKGPRAAPPDILERPKLYIFRYIRKNVYFAHARLYIFSQISGKKCIVFWNQKLLFMDESGKKHC